MVYLCIYCCTFTTLDSTTLVPKLYLHVLLILRPVITLFVHFSEWPECKYNQVKPGIE